MGLYDAEVKERLGREAFNHMVDRVSSGVISGQHMKDIASQLHPHIFGNHLRRMESGKACDDAEFRRILSDWFNQELYNLDQKTALSRLISILKDPSVSLPAEGRRLKQILEGVETNQSGASRWSMVLGSTLSLNDDVSIVKNGNIHVAINEQYLLQDSVSKFRERCAQELEELRKHQTGRVQLLLQQQEEKEQKLKAENERVLSLLLEEHESQEALMLARHEYEESAARKSDELKTERNASTPSQPQVPECPVGNFVAKQ